MCLACSYLPNFSGLPSQILWLAAGFWLSVIEAEERDGRRLVAGGIVLLTCRSLLVWRAVHPPGDTMQVSLVRWQMCVQPRNRSLHFPQVADREWALCVPCCVSGNTPISLPVYNCSLSFAWHEEVTNFLIAWWTMFWLSTEGGEKGRPQGTVFECLYETRFGPPWHKKEVLLPKVCLFIKCDLWSQY